MEENKKDEKKMNRPKGSMARYARMTTLKEEEMDELHDMEEPDEQQEEEAEDQIHYAHKISPLQEETEETEDQEDQEEELEIEHFGDIMQFDVNLSVDNMFRFMLRHAYFGITGIVGVGISVAAGVMFFMGMGKNSTLSQVMLVFAALLFTVINPLLIYSRAKKQAKTVNADNAAYTYIFSDAGIEVQRKEERVVIKWENIIKVREGKSSIYMYLALNRAFVLPHVSYPNQIDKMHEIILKNMNPRRCRLKQV